jgi:carboxyvinyl-carboxyphosphonate phosphorylmutase
MGRTSAASAVGLDETIARIRAYEHAGVDAIFLAGVKKEAELAALSDAVKLPLILGMTSSDLMMNRALLAKYRVRICMRSHKVFWAAVQGAYNAMAALLSGTAPEDLTGIASEELIEDVTRVERYARAEVEFLGVAQTRAKTPDRG